MTISMHCKNQAFPKRGQSAIVATEELSVLLTAIPPKGTPCSRPPSPFYSCYLHGGWASSIQVQFWLFGYLSGNNGEEIVSEESVMMWPPHSEKQKYICHVLLVSTHDTKQLLDDWKGFLFPPWMPRRLCATEVAHKPSDRQWENTLQL